MALEIEPGDVLRDAVAAQPAIFTRADVLGWLERHAPDVDALWADGRLTAETVNDPGRQHFPAPKDLVYLRLDGRYERYDPAVHGWWSPTGRPMDAGFGKADDDARARSLRAVRRSLWRARHAG